MRGVLVVRPEHHLIDIGAGVRLRGHDARAESPGERDERRRVGVGVGRTNALGGRGSDGAGDAEELLGMGFELVIAEEAEVEAGKASV